jgi:hypothetical protein
VKKFQLAALYILHHAFSRMIGEGYMKKTVAALMCLAFLAGCQTVLKSEPGKGQLRFGQKVLVDDGSCPTGEIKQVTGGNGQGIPRKKECIVTPKQ